MLGRYVMGTLFVLGVAMLVAPDVRQDEESAAAAVEVTRTEAAPSALATPVPVPVPSTAPAAAEPAVTVTGVPSLSAPQESLPDRQPDLIEAAILASEATAEPEAAEADAEIAGIAALAGLEPAPGGALGAAAPQPQPQRQPQQQAAADGDLMFVTGSRVNVRSGPSTEFSVIDSVAYGEAVEIVAFDENGWAEIRLADTGETGFMAARFLDNTPGG